MRWCTKNGTVTRLSRFLYCQAVQTPAFFRSSRAKAGTPLFFLPLTPSPPTMPSSALREDHLLRCTKKRDSHSAVPFFCIAKLFKLLHFSGVRARRRARGTIFQMPPRLCIPLFKGRFPNFYTALSRAQPLQRPRKHGAFYCIPHKIGIQPQIAPVRRFEPLLGDAR